MKKNTIRTALGRSIRRGLPRLSSYGGPGVTPGEFFENIGQIGVIWYILEVKICILSNSVLI